MLEVRGICVGARGLGAEAGGKGARLRPSRRATCSLALRAGREPR